MINLDALKNLAYPQMEQSVQPRDAMLYALGIGLGDDPTDPWQLRFVYEGGLQVFPTMAITLCYPSGQVDFGAITGLNPHKVLHVYQRFELARPIPIGRPLVGQTRVVDVFDKGPGRGVLWAYRNEIRERASGELVCTLDAASMCVGAGGTGWQSAGAPPPKREVPSSAPTAVVDIATLPQAALIYRLSGDYNPVHADPELARRVGFPRPILHGRCTFGVAGRAVAQSLAAEDRSLRSMQARFTAPVYPGEIIRTQIWRDGEAVSFRASVPARGAVVLDGGYAELL